MNINEQYEDSEIVEKFEQLHLTSKEDREEYLKLKYCAKKNNQNQIFLTTLSCNSIPLAEI